MYVVETEGNGKEQREESIPEEADCPSPLLIVTPAVQNAIICYEGKKTFICSDLIKKNRSVRFLMISNKFVM